MKATDILKSEHDTIKRMLAVLDSVCNHIEHKETVAATDLVRIVEFIRAFTDNCHHGKEEELFFETVEKLGPKEAEPLMGELMTEHTLGRAFVDSMSDEVSEIVDGIAPHASGFVEFARSYVFMMAHHICKEEHILYPTVDGHLTDEQQKELYLAFDKTQQDRFTSDVYLESAKMVAELEETYGATARIIRLCEHE